VSIWYVYPAYQESVAHKETLRAKQKQLSILEERAALVDNLAAQLNRNTAVKDFLFRYIPLKPDEEYVINAIDDAAKRAGINLVLVDVLQEKGKRFFRSEDDDSSMQYGTQTSVGTTEDVLTAVPQIKRPEVGELLTDIVAVGTYDGLKKFFDEMHKIDRMHGVMTASLERVKEEDKSANDLLNVNLPQNSENVLLGQAVASFAYMGSVKIPRGADSTLFKQGINTAKVQEMQALHTSAPALSLEGVGRVNPFAPAEEAAVAAPTESGAVPTGESVTPATDVTAQQ